MKKISLVLNVLLIVAVGYLYFLHFNEGKSASVKLRPSATQASKNSHPLIAYVDLDSLNKKISYIEENRKSLEAEQSDIEREWENGYRNLENQKKNFLKKGAAITQDEAEKFQSYLLEQQQLVDNKKQMLSQKLNEKSYKFMEGIQNQLKKFLEEYNESKAFTYIFTTGNGLDYMVYKDSSLNITQDVIDGMNEKLGMKH